MTARALPDPGTPFGARVRRRLREEQVIWLITVGRDGTPQPNPVGFVLQDDGSILTYNAADANRITHVADRPRVALHLDGDGTGGDIVVLTGTACRADDAPRPHQNPSWLAKYGETAVRRFGSAEAFGERFPVPLRIEITRVRGL